MSRFNETAKPSTINCATSVHYVPYIASNYLMSSKFYILFYSMDKHGKKKTKAGYGIRSMNVHKRVEIVCPNIQFLDFPDFLFVSNLIKYCRTSLVWT